MRRRTLHPEEQEIWQAVARTAKPMHKIPQVFLKPAEPKPQLTQTAAPATPRLPLFRLGEKSRTKPGHDILPNLAESLASAPLQMDAKTHGKMTRGKLAPEARIDLHGLTLSEAHPELIRFILNAQSAGMRLVLVITGKGKRGHDVGPIPSRMGALRHQVPQWLRLPPLGPAVLQISEAHLKHGGSGAYYIYLRRR
ncbi:MAG: Smr/MutS family protein [Cypionkella sp.]